MKRTFTRHFFISLLCMLLGMQHAFAVAPDLLRHLMHTVMPHHQAALYARPGTATAPVITDILVFTDNFHYGDDITLYVSFSEPVDVNLALGPVTLDVQMSDHTLRTFVCTGRDPGDNTSLELHYTVQDGDFQDEGHFPFAAALVAPAGAITSLADGTPVADLSTAGAVDDTYSSFISGVVPHVLLTPDPLPAKVSGPFIVTAEFSPLSMINVSQSIFTVTNGTITQFNDNLDGQHRKFSVQVTPTLDGALTVNIPANAVSNIQNNRNFASNTLSTLVDETAPSVIGMDVPADNYYNATNTLQFTVHFSENVYITGAPTLDVIIGSTTVKAHYVSGTGTQDLVFSYQVLDGADDPDGIDIGTLQPDGGTIQDDVHHDADLTLHAVPSTAGVKINTTHPTVVLSVTGPAIVNAPFHVAATFSEWVTGLDAADFTVVNGSVNAPTTADNIHYTFEVVPATPNLPVSVSLPADKAANVGHNGNQVSNMVSVLFDPTAPVITAVTGPASATYIAGQELSFKVVFSEPVNVTGVPYLDITIGSSTVKAGYASGAGDSVLYYKYTVVDGDNDPDGVAVTAANAGTGAIRDVAGNDADLTLDPVVIGDLTGVLVNTHHPEVTITGPAVAGTSFTATVTFSETVTGLSLSDFVVTNGTLSNLTTTNGIVYTVKVVPLADGAITLQLPANVVQSAQANGNNASNTLSVRADVTAPVITGVDVPADGIYNAGRVLSFTVHYSENVTITGAPVLPVIMGAFPVQGAYVSGSGTSQLVFHYMVQHGDQDMDGIGLGAALLLNGGTIRDSVGNDGVLGVNHVASMANVRVNTTHPGVVIASPPATVTAPFSITITFSEAVTGFTGSDFVLTNASVSNLQSSDGKVYTAWITPGAAGSLSISIPADIAVSIADNGNTASNTLNIVFVSPAPVINTPPVFQAVEHSPAGTAIGTLTATASTGTLQQWTITSDDTNGAFQIGAGTGGITVKDVALLNAKVHSTAALTVTVSDGFNVSTPATVHINIIPAPAAVNQPPVLDAVTDRQTCAIAASQQIQLTGGSPVEAGQELTYAISTDKPFFTDLAVDHSGLISYTLKPGTTGTVNLTVLLKDNGGTANGGVDSLRVTFALTINALPDVSISADKEGAISPGESITLTADAPGANKYDWNTGTEGRLLYVQPGTDTTYTVTASTGSGCTGSASYHVQVMAVPDAKITSTNFLTPNGDGHNDRWIVNNLQNYTNYNITIFDRAGRVVFYTRHYNNDWGGTVNGDPLAEGTYYYVINVEGLPSVKGFITIIRDINK